MWARIKSHIRGTEFIEITDIPCIGDTYKGEELKFVKELDVEPCIDEWVGKFRYFYAVTTFNGRYGDNCFKEFFFEVYLMRKENEDEEDE